MFKPTSSAHARFPRKRGILDRLSRLFSRTRKSPAALSPNSPPPPAVTGLGDLGAIKKDLPLESTAPQRRILPLRHQRLALTVLAAVGFLALVQVAATVAALSSRGTAAPPEGSLPPRAELEAANRSLRKKLSALGPRGTHIVIDTAANRLYLRDGQQVLRDAVVSCGSGSILSDPVGGRTWVFDTPRGEFQIRSRQTDPNWIKPDWAFIEEGEPIPNSYNERVEPGMLGEYAMGIGGGYFIHGTLYKRTLGRNVTHGCVRVGDEDLEFLFKRVPLGTRVYIF